MAARVPNAREIASLVAPCISHDEKELVDSGSVNA